MADLIREYFDTKVPIRPGGGPKPPGSSSPRTWQQAWNNLSKQLYVTMPNQLNRTRVNRNRFRNAVR